MSLLNWERNYPVLYELFGAHEKILTPSHPLGYLISIDEENVRRAALKTEGAARIVRLAAPDWLGAKCHTIIVRGVVEASATLSEIRAYGDLLSVWREEHVRTNRTGADFVVEYGEERISIEVHTPQGRSDPAKVSRHLGGTTEGNVTTSILAFAPFGFPQDSSSTVQSEAAYWMSRGKEHKGHQFPENAISILWLDFNDPGIWPIPMSSDQALPVMSGRESLTSGCFWTAFYGEEGDAVLDDLNVFGMSGKPYRMPFPGRFNRDASVDFVIIDTLSDKIIFQNHKGDKQIRGQLFREFFRLPRLSLKHSWLDWPVRGWLVPAVACERQKIEMFTSAFKVW